MGGDFRTVSIKNIKITLVQLPPKLPAFQNRHQVLQHPVKGFTHLKFLPAFWVAKES
jgi:hypothetical protein